MWLPLRKRLCRTTPGPGYEVGGRSSTAGTARQVRLPQLGKANRPLWILLLDSDRPFHRCTALLMEEEARLSRAAWARSMDACDQVHSEGISLRTTESHAQAVRETISRGIKIVKAQDSDDSSFHTRSRAMITQSGVTCFFVLAARATTRNGDDSHTSGTGARRNERTVRECTYQDFMKCQPLFFRGTEGVVNLTQWFERMETVFRISNYHRGEINPKTMQEAIEMATDLMDRRINTLAERQTENKRKFEDAPRNNQNQQPNKRQNTGRAYAAGNGDKKSYEGTKPLCPKCNFNHYGPCIPKCTNCKKLGHLAKDCRSRSATANNNNNNRNNNNNNNRNNNNPRAQGANTNAIICFECGAPGHFRKNCPQWKNKNQGNGSGVARAYAVGVAGQNPDNNVVTVESNTPGLRFKLISCTKGPEQKYLLQKDLSRPLFWHILPSQGGWRQVKDEATARSSRSSNNFHSEYFPEDLPGSSILPVKWNFHIDLVNWCCTL
ncbi:putative reverse transcriptase domain-containing protein [Tanacetum coccineum]